MLSEKSLKKTATYCMFPFIWLSGKGKTMGQNQISDYHGLGERGEGELQGMQKNLWKQEIFYTLTVRVVTLRVHISISLNCTPTKYQFYCK